MLVIHTDGACAGNPGPMGIGIVMWKNGKKIKEISEYIGEGTNNIAEYSAVIWALEEAQKLGEKKVLIKTDSELFVKQLKGEYKVKSINLKEPNRRVHALCLNMHVKFEHVPREKNKLADKLSKEAIKDAKKS